MDAVVIIGGAQALFLAILVFTKKGRTTADLLLSLILLASAAAFSCVYLAYGRGWQGALLFILHGNLLLAPLFYLYVTSSTEPGWSWRRGLPHLLPFLAASLHTLAIVLTVPEAEIEALVDAPFSRRPFAVNVFYVMDLAATPLYLPLAWSRLRRHRRRIDAAFSYHEHVDLGWMRVLILVMTVTWLAVEVPLLSSGHLGWPDEGTSLRAGFALSTVLVFFLGYFGFRQTAVFTGFRAPAADPDGSAGGRYRKSGLGSEDAKASAARLRTHMEEEKPFLDKALSIQDLAGRVGLSPHNLSQVLNEELGESFYDFVNRQRVEEVKRRVRETPSHLTLLDIALECGFSSKSSFNRVFKRFAGQTPSQFARDTRR